MGPYDECRPRYCSICGQVEELCEHSNKKNKEENVSKFVKIDESFEALKKKITILEETVRGLEHQIMLIKSDICF